MKITVLVATYKRPRFLEMCLESLAGQKRLPDEIVVVVRPEDTETLAESFQSVQDQLTELYAQVEIGLRTDQQQWADSALTDPVTLDTVLLETQTLETTLARIDTVLSQ